MGMKSGPPLACFYQRCLEPGAHFWCGEELEEFGFRGVESFVINILRRR